MGKTFHLFRAALVLALLAGAAHAQTGSVRGSVTDALSGDPLISASVRVLGTGTGAATDADGAYRINGLSAGPTRFVASYIGFASDTLAATVVAGEAVTLDFRLTPEALLSEGVEVTAQLEGQLGAIREQRDANTIVNVVSADRIRELPDANAAESVGRLPGVSLQRDGGEGTRVQVRGLDPGLTSVTINGERIPGSGGSGFDGDDASGRSVDLSLISADLLEGIELFKALTPDKDADAIGGTVNLVVREAPEGFRGRVRSLGGYNDLEGTFESVRLDGNVSGRVLDDRVGLIATANFQRAPRGYVGKQAEYEDGFDIDEDPVPRSFEADRRDETRERAGASVTADLRLPGGGVQARALYSRSERDQTQLRLRYRLGEGDFERASRTQLRVADLFSGGLSGEHALGRLSADWNVSLSQSLDRTPDGIDARFRQGSPFPGRVQSDFQGLPLAEIAADAETPLSETYVRSLRRARERALDRDVTAALDLAYPVAEGAGFRVELRGGGKVRDKGRESDYTRSEVIARDFERFAIAEGLDRLENGLPAAAPYFAADAGRTADGLPLLEAPDLDAIAALDAQLDGFYIDHPFFDQRDYTADETVGAGYGLAEVTLGGLLVVAGVRYEQTETSFVGVTSDFPTDLQRIVNARDRNPDAFTSRDTTGSQSYGHFFPQLVARYRVSPTFDVRAAVTRTLARPDYLDLVAYENVNDIDNEIDRGNSDLRPTLAWNADAGVSAYTPVGLFAVGGFYKTLQDFQYDQFSSEILPGEGTFLVFQTVNGEAARVYGVELEAQANFLFLPGALAGLLLNANYAYTVSEADFPFEFDTGLDLTTGLTVPEQTSRQSSLPGQSAHVANVTLGYERGGFSARLSVSHQGSFLSDVAQVAYDPALIRYVEPDPSRPDFLPLVYDDPATEAVEGGPITQALVNTDVRTQPYTFLDLQVSQDVPALDGLRLVANLSNLTDQFERQRRLGFAQPVFSRGYGWSGEFGLQLSF